MGKVPVDPLFTRASDRVCIKTNGLKDPLNRAARLCALAILIATAGAAQENSRRNPMFLNPARPAPLSPQPSLPAAELIGYDIEDMVFLRDGVPAVRVAKSFTVILYWLPRSASFWRAEAFVKVVGAGPTLRKSYPIDVEDLPLGVVYRQRCDFEIPRFTHAGLGKIVVGIQEPRSPDQEVALAAGPLRAIPIVTTSPYSDAQVQEAFGEGAVRLKASFRLGPGARISIPLPQSIAKPVAAIGIVSSLVYGNVDAGETICEIGIFGSAIEEAQLIQIRAGENTALENYDKLRPGTQRSPKIEIFESFSAPDLADWGGEAFERHRYAGRIPLPSAAAPERLEFRYVRDSGMIDVKEVVLLFE